MSDHPQSRGSDVFTHVTHEQRLRLTSSPAGLEPEPISCFFRSKLPPTRPIEDEEVSRLQRVADYRHLTTRLFDGIERLKTHLRYHAMEVDALAGVTGGDLRGYCADLANWCHDLDAMLHPGRSAIDTRQRAAGGGR
jgi:hypothetical protein